MKLILSRKGFDSEAGGYASPILPDGTMVSLPIPDDSSVVKYDDLYRTTRIYQNTESLFCLMDSLSGGKIKSGRQWKQLVRESKCHLDPDIDGSTLVRSDGWRGAFGQVDQAATQLHNQGVEPGDIFLFFGWFRRTIECNGRIIFDKRDATGKHILFGYLQIGEIVNLSTSTVIESWLKKHPHLSDQYLTNRTNTLYLASEQLSLVPRLKGYGKFSFSSELVLSKEGQARSKWQLPDLLKDARISYHTSESWKEGYFQSAHRGQEFVVEAFDKTASDKIKRWVKGLIDRNTISCQQA